MANPLKVLTALSASYGAAVSGSDGLKVQQGGLVVDQGGANITGQLTANSGIVVLNGSLISGSGGLQIAGTSELGGDVTIGGNLTVNGTTTTINTENLVVEDYNIVLGNVAGGATDDSANGGGIILSGTTNKTLTWNDNTDSWTSSEHLDLAAGKSYKLAGGTALQTNTLSRTVFGNPVTVDVKELVTGSSGKVSVGSYTNMGQTYGVAVVSGSQEVYLESSRLILSGTTSTQVSNGLTVFGTSTLAGVSAQYVTASVGVSASVFVLADGTQLTSSTQLGGGGGGGGDATKAGVESAYNALRYIHTGSLDVNGYAEVNLTSIKVTEFAVANLNKLSIDVMTSPSGSGLENVTYWNNDLVSVKLENSASALYAKIDAPAAPESYYRLIAINESDFDVV